MVIPIDDNGNLYAFGYQSNRPFIANINTRFGNVETSYYASSQLKPSHAITNKNKKGDSLVMVCYSRANKQAYSNNYFGYL